MIGQRGGASRWRVCYQRGLPRLVFCKIMNDLEHCELYLDFVLNPQ